jgi:hypothetical protein
VVRLDQEAGAAAAQEGGEECPTFFADYFAGKEEEAQQASAPAPRRASKATADAQGEDRIDPPEICLQVYDPCDPASCSYDPQKCEGWGPDEGTPGCAADEKIVDGECVPISETPAAWSARRASPSEAALAVLGLAVGGSLLHSVWKNR